MSTKIFAYNALFALDRSDHKSLRTLTRYFVMGERFAGCDYLYEFDATDVTELLGLLSGAIYSWNEAQETCTNEIIVHCHVADGEKPCVK